MARSPKDKDKTTPTQELPTAPEAEKPSQEVTMAPEEGQASQEAPVGQDAGQGIQEAPVAPEERVRVNAPNKLNLRDGPHRDFHVLTELPDRAELVILYLPGGAEVPGWALVRYGEGEEALVGWVNADYLDEQDETL